MPKFSDRLFDYTGQLKFKSNVPPEEAVKRLSNMAKSNSMAIELFSAVPSSQVVGKASEQEVVFRRVRPLIGPFYNPFFYGSFVQENGRWLLVGKFTIRRFSKVVVTIFSFVWFVGVLLSAFAIIGNPSQFSGSQVFALVLIVVAVVMLIVVPILLVKHFTRKDVDWISAKISQAI